MDVNTTFLNDYPNEDIYLEQVKGLWYLNMKTNCADLLNPCTVLRKLPNNDMIYLGPLHNQ